MDICKNKRRRDINIHNLTHFKACAKIQLLFLIHHIYQQNIYANACCSSLENKLTIEPIGSNTALNLY